MMILIGNRSEEWERDNIFIDGQELSPDMNKIKKR